ncbi:MAG TPA: alpha/beta hydrolase [Gemmatimonadota bacterium]|nr:alpha/beta hydrolase [Gemmatimonadota bacterium]
MRGLLKKILLGAAVVVTATALWITYEFVLSRGGTPAIVDSSGRPVPNSVAELDRVDLGGAPQWILIRGWSRKNPVVLFLHGGPGMSAMYLAHAFQRPLERDFTVVQWDRRGAGKSYDGCAGSYSVRQTLEDTYELTRRLRRRFGQRRIYLVGHSWGTYLGLLAVREHPEYYRAYVGVAQMTPDSSLNRAAERRALAERALAVGDTVFAAEIRSGNRSPTEDDLFRYGGELWGHSSYVPILWTGLWAPEYTLADVLRVPRGPACVGPRMRRDVDLGPAADSLRLAVPVYFFMGAHDLNTPPGLARAYLDRISAPLRRFVLFESSAHFPFLEEPDRFRGELERMDREVTRYREASGWSRRAHRTP